MERETSGRGKEAENEKRRKYREAGGVGKSLKTTSSFLAAGAGDLDGVNQSRGAQRGTAHTKRGGSHDDTQHLLT